MSKELAIDTPRRKTKSKVKRWARRIAWVAVAAIVLYLVVGYVATIPVVGNDPYWRTLRRSQAILACTPKKFRVLLSRTTSLSLLGTSPHPESLTAP